MSPMVTVARRLTPLACGLLLTSSAAFAQQISAVAEALFHDGRTLMAAGDLKAACPKFAESNRIDPKIGTLMNLALCHEKSGLTASAWAEYTQAATLAQRAGQPDREKVGLAHAAELEPTLSRVVIEADAASGVAVVLDDQPVGPAVYRTPIPVDPGAHVLHATASGMRPFEQSFKVEQGGSVTRLKVPPLEPAPASGPEPAAGGEAAAAPAPASSTRRTVGFIVGGAGVVLAGVGAYFGAKAFSDKNDAENNCYTAGGCKSAGNDAKSAMSTDETLSTIGVVAGLAAAGVGLTLILWQPSERAQAGTSVKVGVNVIPRGLEARISW
jgi:hypothetical protein